MLQPNKGTKYTNFKDKNNEKNTEKEKEEPFHNIQAPSFLKNNKPNWLPAFRKILILILNIFKKHLHPLNAARRVNLVLCPWMSSKKIKLYLINLYADPIHKPKLN